MVPATFFEKRLATAAEVREELEVLDPDAGVRLEGRWDGKRCFAFATKSAGKYTVMVYLARARAVRPAGMVSAREFPTHTEAAKFMESLAARPLRAFVY